MAFDINEARAIVEEARKRGLIRDPDAKSINAPRAESPSGTQQDAEIGADRQPVETGKRGARGSRRQGPDGKGNHQA